jgi:O-glycosyl hydrolase
MKYNNNVGNGTTQNSAPSYTTNPDATTNQLKTDMYQEFAEMCVAYIKIIKQETGIDVYALSIQNEPRFSQSYASCVYNGEAMRDVIKVVGQRFVQEGITTKLFVPEDVGWFDGANSLIQPILADPVARQYVSFIATHGYAFDGITASSTDAQTWNKMYNWGAPYNKELWMTETSGFSNDYAGAMKMAKAMYTALNFGNISAWVHWSLSTSDLDEYCLMSSSGTKSKRYFVSKNFYRYIRPGAVRVKASSPDNTGIYPLSFENNVENSRTIVVINDRTQPSFVDVTGQGLASQYNEYVTTAQDNCKDYGVVNSNNKIFIPANSVVTLYKKN